MRDNSNKKTKHLEERGGGQLPPEIFGNVCDIFLETGVLFQA